MKERKRVLTESQLTKEKKLAAKKASNSMMLLMLLAAQDEAKFDEDTAERILVRASRYAQHLDDHIIRMQEVAEIVKKNTGMELIFWRKK